ncbi:MAG: hypothetical protein ABH825_01020, partial [Candidatus Omnitrophota bacterium]
MKLLAKLLLILSLGAPLSLCRALPCPAQEAKNRAQAGTQQAAPEERALPEKQAPDNDEASISIEEDIIAQSMPSYMYSLKRLIGEAKKNIQRVEREIKQRSFFIKNLPTETKIRDHFEKGNELYEKGELKDARKEWDKALEITKEPEIKRYLEKSEEIAREQEYYKKLEEQEHRREI